MHRACGIDVERVMVLRWVASLGAVTSEALARREGVSRDSARARLQMLQSKGMLAYVKPVTAIPGLFAITNAGLSAAFITGVKKCTVGSSNARHYAECSLAAVELERRFPGATVIGERELRRDERLAKAALASAAMGRTRDGSPRLHRPDLVAWPRDDGDGRPLAVEVELSHKYTAELTGILRAWDRCELVSGVLYVAGPLVEPRLRRTVHDMGAQERIAVVPLASMTGHESGSPSWRPPR